MNRPSQILIGVILLALAFVFFLMSLLPDEGNYFFIRQFGTFLSGLLGFVCVFPWGRPYTTRVAFGILSLSMIGMAVSILASVNADKTPAAFAGVIALLSGVYAVTGYDPLLVRKTKVDGPPCRGCGRNLRSPDASRCLACGLERNRDPSIRFHCPACGTHYQVPANDVDMPVVCQCGQRFVVTPPAPTPPIAPATPVNPWESLDASPTRGVTAAGMSRVSEQRRSLVHGGGMKLLALLLCCSLGGVAIWKVTAKPSLVGRWEAFDGSFWEFTNDGSVAFNIGRLIVRGKYRLLDDRHFESDFGGQSKSRHQFKIVGPGWWEWPLGGGTDDTLVFEQEDPTIEPGNNPTYRRVR